MKPSMYPFKISSIGAPPVEKFAARRTAMSIRAERIATRDDLLMRARIKNDSGACRTELKTVMRIPHSIITAHIAAIDRPLTRSPADCARYPPFFFLFQVAYVYLSQTLAIIACTVRHQNAPPSHITATIDAHHAAAAAISGRELFQAFALPNIRPSLRRSLPTAPDIRSHVRIRRARPPSPAIASYIRARNRRTDTTRTYAPADDLLRSSRYRPP